MFRYCLDVYSEGGLLLFNSEFSSITQVCKCIDRFSSDVLFDFQIYDVVHGRSIDAKELMRCWHA